MLALGGQSPQFPTLASGESSPSSPDNFRQVDDFFLQTQTRIWLGEVLATALDEEQSIADLLANGEILFEVSKEVWNMMLSKDPDLKPSEIEPFASRNIGRYMPYSFVDSFLKMCKALGLDDIDLFSPSDVVEKGDTRKVCVCLRALSKKARSLDLNVPDFDIVTNTIATKAKNDCLDLSSETQQEDESGQCQQEESGSRNGLDNEENVPSPKGGSFLNVESGSGYVSHLINRIYRKLSLEEKERSSQCSTPRSYTRKPSDENEHTSQFIDGDAAEVSSVGSENSMSIHVQNLDFVDGSEIEQSFIDTTHGKLKGAETGLSHHKCRCSGEHTTRYIDLVSPNSKNTSESRTSFRAGDEGNESFVGEPCLSLGFSEWNQKGKGRVGGWEGLSQSPSLLDSYQYIGDKINSTDKEGKFNPNECGNRNKDGNRKPRKRPVLKAVVSGTAVVGAAFLVLLFRKNGREKSGALGKKTNAVISTSGRNLSSGKGKNACRGDGVYPTEKLKL